MAGMSGVEKVLRWIVLGGVFLLPAVALIVADGLFFPYITGKNFVFRIIVEIISFAWLALAICFPRYRPARSWILGTFALFVFIMAIADLQGVNPFKSFWSNFERMDGWITIMHTLLVVVVAACVLNTEQLWRKFFEWSLAVSLFVSMLGILQVGGFLDFGSGGTGLSARIDATFGNPIYLAIYMLFNVFIAALLWLQHGEKRWERSDAITICAGLFLPFIIVAMQSPAVAFKVFFVYIFLIGLVYGLMQTRRSAFLGVVIALDTMTLLLTGTRGAELGLIGGAVVALVLYAFSRESSKRFKLITAGSIATLVVLGGALYAARDVSFVQNIGFLQRLSSISLSDNTAQARFLNISMAWHGIEERPILGWGQENYAIVFDKYYDPRMYAQEQWFDRVHNIVFDWWVAGGTLGLLAYLSIFAATLWALWKSIAFSKREQAILVGLLVGYFIHNLTVFDNVTSYILFASVLGYIVFRVSHAQGNKPLFAREWVSGKSLPIVASVCGLLALGSVWYVNANAYAANLAILDGLNVR
ncbi:MAG TPA: O-antigen ligase family protein, partial [Candidatus Paceibacterota bacterium]|nr:O-antigen ligase family protein [Candidatus Paceibacterota bacterium]